VQTCTEVALKGRVSGELHAALIAYRSYYRESIGQPIEIWPLVVHMVQRFVETDREFQTWRRRTRNGLEAERVTS